MSRTNKIPKTFVASVRVDFKDIASIAVWMYKRKQHFGTAGKVASEAVRILANTAQKSCPIKTLEQAVEIFREMGYNDPLVKGTRYYDSLYGELELEKTKDQDMAKMVEIAKIEEEAMRAPEVIKPTISIPDQKRHDNEIKEQKDSFLNYIPVADE